MSTHNIPFSIYKKKITLNYPKSAARDFPQGTQEQVQNRGGKPAISDQATEALLYMYSNAILAIIIPLELPPFAITATYSRRIVLLLMDLNAKHFYVSG